MRVEDVICPYKDKCLSYPAKCRWCKHNKGKRDYFEPAAPPDWIVKFEHPPWKKVYCRGCIR